MTTRIFPNSIYIRRHRGVAEIELLLAIPTMIVILFLLRGAMQLQTARQRTSANSNEAAFRSASAFNALDLNLAWSWSLRPAQLNLNNVPAVIPTISGFPNRAYIRRSSEQVVINVGGSASLSPTKISAAAGVIGPSWTWTGWPHPVQDAGTIQKWYGDCVDYGISNVRAPLSLPPN
jgi:hypothetical protein